MTFAEVIKIILPPLDGKEPKLTSGWHRNDGKAFHGSFDFNYGVGQTSINLTHPTVYSPVNGEKVWTDVNGDGAFDHELLTLVEAGVDSIDVTSLSKVATSRATVLSPLWIGTRDNGKVVEFMGQTIENSGSIRLSSVSNSSGSADPGDKRSS
ncbi:MAG: hypothetical protein LBL73_11300 [Synergistaceae bacterium]|nr:hypothetical protein [Synergistaceae bacterium]